MMLLARAVFGLWLALGATLAPPPPKAPECQRTNRGVPMTARDCWAWIVMGEAGGHWEQASLLVAWTLRAWELEYEMPASSAGRLWGWFGWQLPNAEAYKAVDEAWGRPLLESPFAFMQLGTFCTRLGSAADVRLWQSMGAWGTPDFSMPNPQYPNFSINCYYPRLWTKALP